MARHAGEGEELAKFLMRHPEGKNVGLVGVFKRVAGAIPATHRHEEGETLALSKNEGMGENAGQEQWGPITSSKRSWV